MLICFPDDSHVTMADNITYRQARLAPSEPVLAPFYFWEQPRVNLYGSVFRSARGYEMYYQCGNAVRVGYAQSDDGLHWHRPMINVADFSAAAAQVVMANDEIDPLKPPLLGKGHTLTNLAAACHMPSVIYEPDSPLPYKLFAFGEDGYRVMHSRNGLQFTEYDGNPVILLLTWHNPHTDKTWCSDVAPCFRDREGYTAMVKTYAIDAQGRTRRCVGRSTSTDFVAWSPVQALWEPGEAEDAIARRRGFQWADFYGLCPFPWGSGYLGFLWMLEIERELTRGTNQGKTEVFLAYSPDGLHWRRLADEALIPWDLNFGDDGGMVTTPGAPVFDASGIKLYYSDSNYEHGMFEKEFTKQYAAPVWVIRCATLPPGRLVGAWSEQGRLRLREVSCTGGPLRLNLSCPEGALRVDYLVAGQCVASQTVTGVDETALELLPPVSGSVELELHLSSATLYSIELPDTTPAG